MNVANTQKTEQQKSAETLRRIARSCFKKDSSGRKELLAAANLLEARS